MIHAGTRLVLLAAALALSAGACAGASTRARKKAATQRANPPRNSVMTGVAPVARGARAGSVDLSWLFSHS